MKNFHWMIIALLLLLLALSGCSTGERPQWTNAPGWSRAPYIGINAIGDPVPFAADENGDLYFLFITSEQETLYPQVVGIDRTGERTIDVRIPTVLIQPDIPAIVWDGELLQLFWISNQALYQASMTPDGVVVRTPTLLSGDIKTGEFDVTISTEGTVAVWFSGPRREPGLYQVDLHDGSILLLDELGIRPQLAFDESGALHALWAHYPPGLEETAILYAAYPDGRVDIAAETIVAEPVLGISNLLEGPQLGLDDHNVFVLWTERIMTGMQSGSVRSTYLWFPIGQPGLVSSEAYLRAPQGYELPYSPWDGGAMQAGARFDVTQSGFSRTGTILEIAPSYPPDGELAIAFNIKADYLRRKSELQIGVLYLDPAPTSYQLISFTAAGSQSAYLANIDSSLYLTWLEKTSSSAYDVYFSTTSTDLSAALNNIQSSDILAIIGQTLFGFISGMLLLPMGLIWIVVPIIVIAIASMIRREEADFWSPYNLGSILLALGAYWASKLMILPGINSYVPFSAWIPGIPSALKLPLQIGVPALIAASALFLAYRFTRSREQQSSLFFVLVYAALDGILTLGVYGVLIYGG
ncbi:MAG: hypothetical protein JXA97_13085 [Anaerolineales bacterium]|nr:hypothetical protein [Anaerolineales bacterium]